MPAKKQQQQQQLQVEQQREPSISVAREVSARREPSLSVSRVDHAVSKSRILPTYFLIICLVAAWFTPVVEEFTIWNLLISNQNINSSKIFVDPEQQTALRIALVSLFCSSMAAALGNRALTAFLTLAGVFVIVGMSITQVDLKLENPYKLFISGDVVGPATWIFAVVNAVLQCEMKVRK